MSLSNGGELMAELKFIEVTKYHHHEIEKIHEILKASGENLYNTKGLLHWKTPYPIEAIKENIENRTFFIVKDEGADEFIHTFQLEIKMPNEKSDTSLNEITAEINKFATLPSYEGRGIGTQSIDFIEKYCASNSIHRIFLEVYDQSFDAIHFYKSKGFAVIGERKTRYFTVLQMEKIID